VHQHPLAWAREHGAEFSPAKYDVLHLAPAASHVKLPETIPRIEGFIEKKEKELAEAFERKEKDDARRQKGERVEKRKIGTPTMTIVGLTVQSNLLWDAHVKEMRQKSGQLVQNFKRFAGRYWGPTIHNLRHLYLTAYRPAITYACAASFVDPGNVKPEDHYAPPTTLLKRIEPMQNKFLNIIAGAYMRTNNEMILKELCIEDLQTYMMRMALATRARIRGSEVWDTITQAREEIWGLEMGPGPIRVNPATEMDEIACYFRQGVSSETQSGKGVTAKAINKAAGEIGMKIMKRKWSCAKKEMMSTCRGIGERPAVLAEDWDESVLNYYRGLTKQESAILFQLRTEVIPLQGFLAKHNMEVRAFYCSRL
jgi:hypothetical protein